MLRFLPCHHTEGTSNRKGQVHQPPVINPDQTIHVTGVTKQVTTTKMNVQQLKWLKGGGGGGAFNLHVLKGGHFCAALKPDKMMLTHFEI